MISQKYKRLDILINNACQTIRKPSSLNDNLVKFELKGQVPEEVLKLMAGANDSVGKEEMALAIPGINAVRRVDEHDHIGSSIFDVDGQFVDTRTTNTWVKELDEVSIIEYLEVQTVNSTAPFILCSRLKQLMAKTDPT